MGEPEVSANPLRLSRSLTYDAPHTQLPHSLHKTTTTTSQGQYETSSSVGVTTLDSTSSTVLPPPPHISEPTRSFNHVSTAPEKGPRPALPPKAETEAVKPAPKQSRPLKRGVTSGRPNASFRLPTFTHSSPDPEESDTTSSSSEDEWQLDERERKKKEDQAAKEIARRRRKQNRGSVGPSSKFNIQNDEFHTKGRVSKRDGRLNISVNETSNKGYLAKALGTGLKHHFSPPAKADSKAALEADSASVLADDIIENEWNRPRLNIVVMVIGSRGDIQPFLKIGKVLKNEYGHRVRIATHPAFKDFVEKDSGLEFFSVGGDPSELMSFMVKNPGLIPSMDSVKAGEIGKRRSSMFEMFQGMWRACINATDDESDKENMKMMGDKHPFVADCIIANPPSFAHVHIAERLGIPLHMMFTFPYTPTTKFSHPLANIKQSNVDRSYTNFMSYPLVELMVWQGLGDLVNKFRVQSLGLEPVSTLWAPGQLYRLHVPYSYLWSPALVPKPPDWGPEIDIAGFVFLDLASSFKPPEELANFLKNGPPPVYIGFGSIVVDDPNKFTQLIFEAVRLAGVRALVSKGWGGFGGGEIEIPENIFMLENTPHDWLFPQVAAAVHHGGAGTTAIGLKCAIPTMIVPFFGDQPFWGEMVSKARAGAFECIPYKKLTAEKLAEGIKQCLTDEAKANVSKIAESIAKEGDGAANAVRSFHRHLPLMGERTMKCSILSNRVAVWQLKGTNLRLSALAADVLVEQKKLRWKDLRLARHLDWNDFNGAGEPLTGMGGAVIGTIGDAGKGVASVPINMTKSIKHRRHHEEKKKKWMKRLSEDQERNSNEDPATISDMGESNSKGGRLAMPGHLRREATDLSALSEDPSENLAEELAEDVGRGFVQTGGALVKAPMDLSLAVAQGFHNAPRLYGDETVRRPVRITGIHSGLVASRNEFFYGIYDGFTGVVTQPYHGAKERGILGFVDGVGMGFGGLVLKNIAAILGPFAYTAKGLHKEIVKHRQPTAFIRKARIIQGGKELRALQVASSAKEVKDISLKPGEVSVYAPRKGETLKNVEEKVDDGWKIVLEVLEAADAKSQEGMLRLKGKMHLHRERTKWGEAGALDSVAMAERALQAHKDGKDVRHVLKRHREVAKKTVEKGITDDKGTKKMELANEAGAGFHAEYNGPNKAATVDTKGVTKERAGSDVDQKIARPEHTRGATAIADFANVQNTALG
ncbi:glycosyltransferase family 1 protein [Venturia nashicola]|uniref:Glycosyltransferase family 1 protein n=1 Tax=Venturia nashicola TaxID=86259 RepID=A0A4Z1NM32_9PEZI|nr:glycosyltransferase family 1 protein [Venturia nashicola]TLD25675.1 glycosyltransferase family 1 protein [Venturia nashicola]